MKIQFIYVCVILCQSSQILHSSVVKHTTPHATTTIHHITTPIPRDERHSIAFHYPHGSLEHLLLAMSYYNRLHAICFVMPLSDQDVHDIQNPKGLEKMEAHMLYQMAHKHYYQWTYDDYLVRNPSNPGWPKGCIDTHRPIYRVYRI